MKQNFDSCVRNNSSTLETENLVLVKKLLRKDTLNLKGASANKPVLFAASVGEREEGEAKEAMVAEKFSPPGGAENATTRPAGEWEWDGDQGGE